MIESPSHPGGTSPPGALTAGAGRDDRGLGAAWLRFWFEPANPRPLALVRILTGILGLLLLWSYASDLQAWFGPDGMVPEQVAAAWRPRWGVSLYDFATTARDKGFKVIIAGAGGAAHLPGMAASMTSLPVFGVPVESKALSGQDSLLSIVQMPAGIPVGTLAIGKAGAVNAALLAASVLSLNDAALAKRLDAFRAEQTAAVAERPKDEA